MKLLRHFCPEDFHESNCPPNHCHNTTLEAFASSSELVPNLSIPRTPGLCQVTSILEHKNKQARIGQVGIKKKKVLASSYNLHSQVRVADDRSESSPALRES